MNIKMNKIVIVCITVLCIYSSSFLGVFHANAIIQNNPDKTNGVQAAVLEWVRNLALEIATMYLARSWSEDLQVSEPVWRPREVVDTDGHLRLDRRQRLIRWDRRGPNVIFRDGFIPQVTHEGPNLDETNLLLYAQSNVRSFFVSTTKTQRQKKNYVWTPRTANSGTIYQYEIYAPGGVDVNESLRDRSPFPNQLEVCFPGGIRSEFIRSAREMRDGRVQRVWMNPRFLDPGDLNPIATRSTTEQRMWHENDPDGGDPRLKRETSALFDQNADQDMAGSNGELIEDPFENEVHSRSIPDGTYKIASCVDQNVVADLSGGHLSSVHAWQYLGLSNQKWTFAYYINKEAYKITSPQSPDLALTWLLQDDRAVGYNFIDYNTQYWKVERTIDGYYKLRNLHETNRVLDLAEGITNNGNKIILYADGTNKTNQKWMLTPIVYQTVRNGKYKISSSINHNVVADLSGGHQSSVHAWQYLGLNNQMWDFAYDCNKEAYKITSSKSPDLALTWMLDDNRAVGNNFIDYDTQYWRIEIITDNYYKFRNLHDTRLVLDLTDGGTNNGNRIQLSEDSTNPVYIPNQKWMLTPVVYQTVPDGEYKISSSIDDNVVADLSGGHQSSVHAWQYKGLGNQKWNFAYDSNKEAYKIISSKSPDLALTWMLDDNRAVGNNFIDYDTQYWRIEGTKDGYYKLRNLHDTKQVLDLADRSTNNGNKIILYEDGINFANQKWALTRLDAAVAPNGEYQISTSINHKKVIDFHQSHHNLIITDNLNLVSSYWRLEYDATKKAYKIYTKDTQNTGFYFQDANFNVMVDNIDVPDTSNLRPYWTIEYNVSKGGYLIRSLHDQTQVLDLKEANISYGTPIISYAVNNNANQIWNLIPSIPKWIINDNNCWL